MKNIDLYTDVFKKILDISDIEKLKLAHLDETDAWTSFKHMKLIVKLEREFNVSFTSEDILSFCSYQTGIEVLKKKGIQF